MKASVPARPISWPVCVTVFFLGSVLLWADRTNFSVAAAAWAKEYHWTPATIGMMLSAFSLGYLILQPFGGWVADRLGPRRTLAGAMAGWSLWVLLTPLRLARLPPAFRGLFSLAPALAAILGVPRVITRTLSGREQVVAEGRGH